MGNVCSSEKELGERGPHQVTDSAPSSRRGSTHPQSEEPSRSSSKYNVVDVPLPGFAPTPTTRLPAIVDADPIAEPQPIFTEQPMPLKGLQTTLKIVDSVERTPSPHSPSRQPSAASFPSKDAFDNRPLRTSSSTSGSWAGPHVPQTPSTKGPPFSSGGLGGEPFNSSNGCRTPRSSFASSGSPLNAGKPPFGPGSASGPPNKSFLPPHLTYVPNVNGTGRKRALSYMKKWAMNSKGHHFAIPKDKREGSTSAKQDYKPFWATLPKMMDDPIGVERSMLEWNVLRLRLLVRSNKLYCACLND